MGAICGVVNLDGQPVDHEKFKCITQALNPLGPDGNTHWIDGPTALACQHRIDTPEARFENLPAQHRDLVITATARLDNRDELLSRFEVPAQEQPTTPDSWLILRAYETLGEECCAHLLGDYCFAVWDRARKNLFLGRDHFGNGQIFYYHTNNHLVFCSSLSGILAWPGLPARINPSVLAATLTLVPAGDFSQTVYRDVLGIPPAHWLRFENGNVLVQRYWSFEDIPELRLGSDEEYLEAFQERFSQAVACRLRSAKPVGAMLSGGLDSGAVAVEAAAQRATGNEYLDAFTAVPAPGATTITSAKEIGDEGPLARATADHAGNIHCHLETAGAKTPLAAIDQALAIHRHPHFSPSNCHWILSIYEEMAARGFGTVLVGQYGNATISWPGNHSSLFRDQLLKGQWGRLMQEFRAMRKHMNQGLLKAIRGYLIAPMLPTRLLAALFDLGAGPEPWKPFSAINPAFARTLGLRRQASKAGIFAKTVHNPAYRNYFVHSGLYSINSLGAAMAAPFGLDRRDPTADKRVIDFCFGIPESQYVSGGKNRLLIRRAMQGRIPDEVLWNPRRGTQSADIVWRVRANAGEISNALAGAERSDLAQEYLDVRRMRAVFEAALTAETLRTRVETQNVLLSGLVHARFLGSLEN